MIQMVEKALRYILILPAFLPLVVFNGILYPYVAPKTFLFRSLGIVAVSCIAFLIFSRREFYASRLQNAITWIPGALLLVAYVTSLIGVDFYHSFWSTFDRGDGLFSLTIAIVFFYTVVLYADEALFNRLLKMIAWVSTLAGVYVFFQWMQAVSGMDFPLVADPRGRFGGTFGNAAFFSSYTALAVGATIYVARGYRGWWQKVLYSGALVQLFAILVAATRGTILALMVAGFLGAGFSALKGEGRAKMYARAVLAALLVIVLLFFSFRAQLANSSIEIIRRVASVSQEDGTVSSRLFVWKNVLVESMKNPITGYGAEHVEVVFNRIYDPSGIVEQWFDRSHNAFLDYFVQFGIVGLALYMALILTIFTKGFFLYGKDNARGLLFMYVAVVYAVQNFFVFDTTMSLWLILMFLAGIIIVENSHGRIRIFTRHIKGVPELIAACILVLLVPLTFFPIRANYLLAQGYLYHILDINKAVTSMEKGLALSTFADLEYGYQAYEMYTDRQATMLEDGERLKAYEYASSLLKRNLLAYPYDARTAVYYAHVLDMTPSEIVMSEDELLNAVEQAILLSPKRMQPYYLRSNVSIRKADVLQKGEERTALYKRAISEMEEYAELVPTFAEPRFVLASLNLAIGDKETADRWANEALPLYRPNLAVAKRAVRYYILTENWTLADRFLTEVYSEKDEQGDYPGLYDHAKVKFLSGDREGAEAIVARLKVESPGLVESDPAFMAAIEKGN